MDASNASRAKRLREQVEARVRHLRDWAAQGVPDGFEAPGSLNRVREWRDERLGIEPIGSPGSFTRTHRIHGAAVREIAELLKDLRARKRRKRPPSNGKLLEKKRRQIAQLERALTAAANRYAQLKVELDHTKMRLSVAEHSLETAKRDLRSRREGANPAKG